MAPIDLDAGYHASVSRHRARFEELIPELDDSGVAIGVQNHSGDFVGSAIGLHQLIGSYEPRHVCTVFEMAHCALVGEPVHIAVDILRTHITRLVNFKSAYRRRMNGPEDTARYKVYWTTHRHAAYDWTELADALTGIGYHGVYCLPAEYSAPSGVGHRLEDDVLPYLSADLTRLNELVPGQIGPQSD